MTLDDLKRTVARTTGPDLPAGTAFLVSATRALTCAHCVLSPARQVVETVTLYFSLWEGEREWQATVESVDPDRDVAVLRLAEPAPAPACPRAAAIVNGARWQSFGYPKPSGRHGLVIGGEVVDVDARTGQSFERRVIQLRCHEAADALHGASGSPVFVDGGIAGMITNQPQTWGRAGADGTRDVEPVYGALFALSVAQIAAGPAIRAALDWREPDAAIDEPRPAGEPTEDELFERYRQIVEAVPKLTSVKVPGGSGAVETVPLESMYVEPELGGLARLDDIWRRRRVAVVGEEGLGKGAFLKHLNLRLLRDGTADAAARSWPLHVELDRFARQRERVDLLDFALDDLLGREGEEPLRACLEARGRDGRLVLLCDGLEHVGADYERAIDALSRQPRFVVALRPGARLDVGQESGGTLRLQPFDQRRIEAFVGRWIEALAPPDRGIDEKRILQAIAGQPSLLELARIPRFLGLICSVVSDGKAPVATRTALVSTAWNTVWQASFGSAGFARRRAVAGALQRLAGIVFERGGSANRELDEAELYDALAEAGEAEPDAVIATLIEHELLAPGRDSGYASRSFRFPLDSFQEHLAADRLANDAEFLAALPDLRIDSRWARILPAVTGILGRDPKRLTALRDFLAGLAALGTGEAFGLHVCLIAECLAEVHPDVAPRLAPLPDRTAAELLRVWTEQPTARARMMPSIRRLQPPAMRRGLGELLEDRSAAVAQRAAAAFALSAFNDREAFERLLQAAASDEPMVRSAACLGLGLLEREGAADALVEALRDPALEVRIMAARCIARRRERELAGKVLGAWVEGSRRVEGNPFLQSVSALAWATAIVALRPEATLPVLLEVLAEEEEPEPLSFAATVLAEAGARAGVWPCILLLERGDAGPVVTRDAAQALARLGTQAAVAALSRALDRGDEAVKLGALLAFSAVEPIRNTPAAELLLDPAEASVTWSMVRAIEAEMFEAQVAGTLESLEVLIARQGRDAVLAEARAELSRRGEPADGPTAQAGPLRELARLFDGDAGDLERVVAFETLQLLEPDPERLVDALFDADSRIAVRASVWIRMRQGELPLEELLERLDASPGDPGSLVHGACLSALGRLEYLKPLVERLRAGSATAAQALWLLGVQYGFRLYEDGRFELPDGRIETDAETVAELLRHLDEATARPPEGADAESALALDSARDEFLAARRSRPEDAAGWRSRAVIELAVGRTESAHASLRHAADAALGRHGATLEDLALVDAAEAGLLLQPAHPWLWDAYLTRSRQRLAAGELDGAHTDAKRVITAYPFHPAARVLRARVWVEQGYPEFAITDLVDLVGRCPDAESRDALADALDELIELRAADAPGTLTEGQRADALGVRGTVLSALGAWDRARSDLEQAVAGGASGWQILNALAWLYADHFEVNLERASELARAAQESLAGSVLANDQDRGAVLHTLGWSYHKLGLRDEARSALEQAAALCPDDAEIAGHLDLARPPAG